MSIQGIPPTPLLSRWTRWSAWAQRHNDFWLLLATFVSFRLGTVWFFRPGGYFRDYSDLIFYQTRASWREFGFLPYREYWSEYPPLFAWFSVWIDTLASQFALWEDERLWYALFFGTAMVAAETVTVLCLYRLACLLYGAAAESQRPLRVLWLYAGLFLPVYLLGGWYDALPVMTIFAALTALLTLRPPYGLLLAGLAAGTGAVLKLVPLAILAVTPLVARRWHALLALFPALLVVAAIYSLAWQNGPTMTLASLHSLTERTGWSTVYALADGFTRLGKVVGDPFDPNPTVGQYAVQLPQTLIWLGWLGLGGALLQFAIRRQPAPQSPWRVVAFAALTYTILLLAYPAWNPQYALYLLPFLLLLWPTARGLLYALLLSALILLEHPIYFNLIGPNYPPAIAALLDADPVRLLWQIVGLRTLLLAVIAVDLAWMIGWPHAKRWLPVGAALALFSTMLWGAPDFLQTYTAGRMATTPLRPVALYFNADESTSPIVTADLTLARTLRPLLAAPDRLVAAGGRPDRVDPLPEFLAGAHPFVYLSAPASRGPVDLLVESSNACPHRIALGDFHLWICGTHPPSPWIQFAEGVQLTAAYLPASLQNPLKLTLFWQATAPIPTDYTVFVHVVDAAGQLVGQWDQVPGHGSAPTSSWSSQQIVVDDYHIDLALADAQYPLRVLTGLYDPADGRRVPILSADLPSADQAVELRQYPGMAR